MNVTHKIMIILVVLGLTTTAAVAGQSLPELPLALAPETTIQNGKFFRYAGLELTDTQGEAFTVWGRYWDLGVTYGSDVATILDHFRGVAEAAGEVLSVPGTRGLHFRIEGPDGPIYAKLHVGGRLYNLDLVAPAPCPRDVVFGNDVYATPRKPDAPLAPPLITDYPGTEIGSGREHEFDRLKFDYRVGRQEHSRTVEGHHWHKIVKIADRPDGLVHHEEIREAYRLAALEAGAEILDTRNRELIFHLPDPENGDLWATLWPQDGKYTLEVVQEAAMQQVLILEKDEMMARLDALGKLTLRGIFFDTARATLKPESDPALTSALELLDSYPDLVLEVGGHTDNVGQPVDNQVLSENRAASVRTWLVEHGVAPKRLQTRGYGEDQPVATNATAVGRAANRRVELKKIAGGQARSLVTLVTPYPGSEEVGEQEVFSGRTVTMYVTGGQGRTQETDVTGDCVVRRYVVSDAKGRPDAKLSGVQIRNNYRRAVLDLGGEILAERTHGLYFRLTGADGRATWFTIWAPGAKYSITAVTPAN